MTEHQQQKLTRIKAACQRAIELGNSATAGPWEWVVDGGSVLSPYADLNAPSRTVLAPRHDGNFGSELRSRPEDRAFIVHARQFTPAAARALLTAVEALGLLAAHDNIEADSALRDIINDWPDEAL